MLPRILSSLQSSRSSAWNRICINSNSYFYSTSNKNPSADGNTDAHGPAVDFGFREVPWSDKQSLVGQVFSSVASSYDVMNDLMSAGMHRLWKDRLVETLHPFEGQHHLDVAGGTGDVAFRVLKAIRQVEAESNAKGKVLEVPGTVVVCDINPQMLAEGKKKAESSTELRGDRGLSFLEGNAESLPFPDSTFDSYSIAFGIRNVTDRDAALREAYRVLKPGGRFLCLEFSHITQPALKDLYDLYSFNVIPKIGGLIANDSASYQYLVESIRKFPDQDAFAAMIKEANFKAVTFENLNFGIVALHSGFKIPSK